MADKVLGSASVEVFADLSKLRTGLSEARRQTTRAASDMSQAAAGARRSFERAGDGLTRSVRTARTETERLNKELRNTDSSLTGIFAGIGAGAALTGVIRLADEFTNLRARIGLVTTAGESADAIFERLFNSAQRNSTSVSALAGLYVNLRQSIAGLGDGEALAIGETLSQSLAISGANASEAASFIRQIGQALASGVLRGDEFNSVMENNARFAKLLREELGVSAGELRAMAEQGKLTADVIRGAISTGGGDLSAEFEALPLTIARAYQQVENALARYVGQTDQGLGASQRLAQGIELLADNFNSLADALVIVGGAGLANVLGRGVARGAAAAGDIGLGLSAAVTAKQADLVDQRERALERMRRQNDVLRNVAGQRSLAAELIRAAEKKIAEAQATLDRRLNEQATPLPGDRRNVNPAKDYTQFNASQRQAVRAYREELDRLNRMIANIRQSEISENGIAARAENIRRAAASSVEDLNTRLKVHNSILSTTGRVAAAAGGLVSRSFGSLVNVLGGPLPALITAIGVALLFYKSSADKAREANNSLTGALGILAGASAPAEAATQGAAEASGDLATKTDLAALAADELAGAHDRAATAARTRTDAEKALAEVQRIQAIATLQSAIADQRKRQAAARSALGVDESTLRNLQGLNSNSANTARAQFSRRAELNGAELADATRSIDLLTRGVEALTSGALVLGGAASASSSATNTFSAVVETAAERTARLKREAKSAAEAVKTLQEYIDEGNQSIEAGEAELDRKAQERQQARVDRARDIIEGATDALTKLREEAAEIDNLFDGGLFAGEEQTAGRAYVDILVAMAEAAGDAAEALALLKNARGLDDEAVAKATDRITGAAREGAANRRAAEDAGKIFRRSDIADVFKDGLYDAVTSGQWKDAFREAIASALGRALQRSVDRLIDVIFDAAGSSGGHFGSGGLFGDLLGTVVGSIFGGGGKSGGPKVGLPKRAAGGPVSAGTLYQVNELGDEAFLPNVDGYILNRNATRAAQGGSSGGGSRIVQNINVDMRGANIEDSAVAAARLEAAARKGAIMGAQLVQEQLRANSTL